MDEFPKAQLARDQPHLKRMPISLCTLRKMGVEKNDRCNDNWSRYAKETAGKSPSCRPKNGTTVRCSSYQLTDRPEVGV